MYYSIFNVDCGLPFFCSFSISLIFFLPSFFTSCLVELMGDSNHFFFYNSGLIETFTTPLAWSMSSYINHWTTMVCSFMLMYCSFFYKYWKQLFLSGSLLTIFWKDFGWWALWQKRKPFTSKKKMFLLWEVEDIFYSNTNNNKSGCNFSILQPSVFTNGK